MKKLEEEQKVEQQDKVKPVRFENELQRRFNKKFKHVVEDKIQEKKDELPSQEEYMKKLVINSGYMSSYQAIETSRNIPGPVKRRYLNQKYGNRRDNVKHLRELQEEYDVSAKNRKWELR